jgi:hypothetical protein
MVSEAEYWKVEEHEPVNPHPRAEMSPSPTRLNRRNADDDAGDVCRRHPNAVVDVARPQGAMERTQPGHGIGIDLRDARTRTATGSLPSARMSSI